MLSNKNIVAIIPARYNSSRFPGKPLALIHGKSMIEWVYTRTSLAQYIGKVIVATDHDIIYQTVKNFGGNVIMTSKDHATGSDRIAEILKKEPSIQFVVNVQGDEPLISADCIDSIVNPLLSGEAQVSTAARYIHQLEDFNNPNIVKVVLNRQDYAIYFSRAPIPYVRTSHNAVKLLGHIGIYGFTREALLRYTEMEQTPLEQVESLEQLRLIDHGYKIKVIMSDYTPLAVDTPEDIEKVEQFIHDHPIDL